MPYVGPVSITQSVDFVRPAKAKATGFVRHRDAATTPQSRPAMVGVFASAPMSDKTGHNDAKSLPLPKDWSASVRNAVLNVIGIVRIAMLAGREALIQEGDVKDARIHQLDLGALHDAHSVLIATPDGE